MLTNRSDSPVSVIPEIPYLDRDCLVSLYSRVFPNTRRFPNRLEWALEVYDSMPLSQSNSYLEQLIRSSLREHQAITPMSVDEFFNCGPSSQFHLLEFMRWFSNMTEPLRIMRRVYWDERVEFDRYNAISALGRGQEIVTFPYRQHSGVIESPLFRFQETYSSRTFEEELNTARTDWLAHREQFRPVLEQITQRVNGELVSIDPITVDFLNALVGT